MQLVSIVYGGPDEALLRGSDESGGPGGPGPGGDETPRAIRVNRAVCSLERRAVTGSAADRLARRARVSRASARATRDVKHRCERGRRRVLRRCTESSIVGRRRSARLLVRAAWEESSNCTRARAWKARPRSASSVCLAPQVEDDALRRPRASRAAWLSWRAGGHIDVEPFVARMQLDRTASRGSF